MSSKERGTRNFLTKVSEAFWLETSTSRRKVGMGLETASKKSRGQMLREEAAKVVVAQNIKIDKRRLGLHVWESKIPE